MNIGLYQNNSTAPTERTTLRRLPDRGSHEAATIHAILDEAFICHLGFTSDRGPVVVPTTYGRVGDLLYVHGSPASRMLRTLKDGVPVCLTVSLVDGLVLARSTFHHSINYRSVLVFGTATEVTGLPEKHAALTAIVEHIVPGRTSEARPATDKEVRGTLVLALPIDEASAKVRTGPPIDEAADLELACWGGVLPLANLPGPPIPDAHVAPGTAVPSSVAGFTRR